MTRQNFGGSAYVSPKRAVNLAPKDKASRYGKDWDAKSAVFRAGKACEDCGAKGTKDNPTQTHDIIPKSARGPSIPMNFKCLCQRCHRIRHGQFRQIK